MRKLIEVGANMRYVLWVVANGGELAPEAAAKLISKWDEATKRYDTSTVIYGNPTTIDDVVAAGWALYELVAENASPERLSAMEHWNYVISHFRVGDEAEADPILQLQPAVPSELGLGDTTVRESVLIKALDTLVNARVQQAITELQGRGLTQREFLQVGDIVRNNLKNVISKEQADEIKKGMRGLQSSLDRLYPPQQKTK